MARQSGGRGTKKKKRRSLSVVHGAWWRWARPRHACRIHISYLPTCLPAACRTARTHAQTRARGFLDRGEHGWIYAILHTWLILHEPQPASTTVPGQSSDLCSTTRSNRGGEGRSSGLCGWTRALGSQNGKPRTGYPCVSAAVSGYARRKIEKQSFEMECSRFWGTLAWTWWTIKLVT